MAPIESDRFETQVFYVEALDKFHTIDRQAGPSADDWVAVKCLNEPGIAIEPFCGQPFIGVVKILEFYELSQSEQGNPKPASTVPIDRINQAPPPQPPTGKSISGIQKRGHMKKHLLPLIFVTAAAVVSSGAPSAKTAELAARSITAAEAKHHIGERKTICGVVASAHYAAHASGQPTFLNLDEPYPRQIFTAAIWTEDRPKFGRPEISLNGKRVCVAGRIEEYQGVPQIVLRGSPQSSEKWD